MTGLTKCVHDPQLVKNYGGQIRRRAELCFDTFGFKISNRWFLQVPFVSSSAHICLLNSVITTAVCFAAVTAQFPTKFSRTDCPYWVVKYRCKHSVVGSGHDTVQTLNKKMCLKNRFTTWLHCNRFLAAWTRKISAKHWTDSSLYLPLCSTVTCCRHSHMWDRHRVDVSSGSTFVLNWQIYM